MIWAVIVNSVLVSMASLFALAFYDRYWRVRDCFNELGRCFEPHSGLVYLEQAGLVWGGLTVLTLTILSVNIARLIAVRVSRPTRST